MALEAEHLWHHRLNHLCGEPRRWTFWAKTYDGSQGRLNHLCGEPRRWTTHLPIVVIYGLSLNHLCGEPRRWTLCRLGGTTLA